MRKRRVAKWVGIVLCVLVLAVGVASMWVVFWPTARLNVSLARLHIFARSCPPIGDVGTTHLISSRISMQDRLPIAFTMPKIDAERSLESFPPLTEPAYVTIPLWLPLLIIAIPTAFLWRSDRRRRPPNHCNSCGYNLTGNVSGTCPECGEVLSSPTEEKGLSDG